SLNRIGPGIGRSTESDRLDREPIKASSGGENTWCIAKPSTENLRLNGNINYSCSQKGVDCKPIQPGGTCYRPNTIVSHASYAMNLFYKAAGKNSWNCHFNGTGIIISENP
ncbi:hypothetical protein Godav_006431, partial [Gossypium davidsonii]|nr:hypothetical protein [Gossypium davidsonii]